MFHIDLDEFPIVILHYDDAAMTLDQVAQFETELDAILARSQPFGILATVSEATGGHDEHKASKDVTKASNDLSKRLKPQLARWCVGYAGVTTNSRWIKLYKPIANVMARNRMGCDGAVFECETEARVWLTKKLRMQAPASV